MTKAEIRQRIWKTIEREAVGRFPFGSGRIPNFVGAEQAGQLLREMAVWRRALVVKVNPDAPQLAVRRWRPASPAPVGTAVPCRLVRCAQSTSSCAARSASVATAHASARAAATA